jgi:7-carboxy-7-deazaguanine synthase
MIQTEEAVKDIIVRSGGNLLPVMEQFYTLQGEGLFQGKAAYFIRLGGCDVGCHWCDVKDSWPMHTHPLISIEELVSEATKYPGNMVVITGGEPLMHPLGPLTTALRQAGLRTHIETSGVYPVSGTWDWICFSPKKFKEPNPEIFGKANELKVIVYNTSDFDFAASFANRVGPQCELILQPEWSKSNRMLPQMVAYVQQNPQWRLSLQTHKFMQIP